jgi:uncharacterized LabA/DUF88 family protein
MQPVPNALASERVALFVNYHATRDVLRRDGRQIDLTTLRSYLAEGRHLVESFVYFARHPQPQLQAADQETLLRLQQHGFLVRSKTGRFLPEGRFICPFGLEMALDVQEFVARTHPDIVVLVLGDEDLTPLARRLRYQGIRVEVAGVPGSLAPSLQAMANGFVDLTQIGYEVDNLPLLEGLVDEVPFPGDAHAEEDYVGEEEPQPA